MVRTQGSKQGLVLVGFDVHCLKCFHEMEGQGGCWPAEGEGLEAGFHYHGFSGSGNRKQSESGNTSGKPQMPELEHKPLE